MNNFYVGQKVVCIDDSKPSQYLINGPNLLLIRNKIYLVEAVQSFPTWSRYKGDIALGINKDDDGLDFWHSKRFRPIEETKTNISIFTKMLIPNKVVETV